MGSRLFSNKAAKRRARSEAARQSLMAFQAVESVKGAEERMRSSEQARLGVFGMLGAPGTFETPGTAGSAGGGTPGAFSTDIFDENAKSSDLARGMLQYGKYINKGTLEATKSRKGIIDPEKYQQAIGQTAGFRIQSKLTSDAEQLLAGKGEAWDQLEQSTLGQIHEGYATALKENLRELKNRGAKGGSARRQALNEANELLVRERVARGKIQETWNANLKLHDYVRANAQRVQESNERFLDNLPGIRDNYNNTMNALSEAMIASSQVAGSLSQEAYRTRAAVGDSKFLEKLIIGAVGVVAGAAGGAMLGSSVMNALSPLASGPGYHGQSGGGGGGGTNWADVAGAGINQGGGILSGWLNKGGGGPNTGTSIANSRDRFGNNLLAGATGFKP